MWLLTKARKKGGRKRGKHGSDSDSGSDSDGDGDNGDDHGKSGKSKAEKGNKSKGGSESGDSDDDVDPKVCFAVVQASVWLILAMHLPACTLLQGGLTLQCWCCIEAA